MYITNETLKQNVLFYVLQKHYTKTPFTPQHGLPSYHTYMQLETFEELQFHDMFLADWWVPCTKSTISGIKCVI